jgi:hypothetical protein
MNSKNWLKHNWLKNSLNTYYTEKHLKNIIYIYIYIYNAQIMFEITQGYYTEQELNNYIKYKILKMLDTPINAYSSTGGNITIPLNKLIGDISLKKY